MSQAPVRRKSRRALAAAAVQKPAPHLVILRVKRKRGDDPVDSLLVSTDEGKNIHEKGMPDRKRRAPDETGSIEETLADLSLEKIACVEQQQQQQQEHLQRQQQPNEVQQRAPKRLCYKRVRTTGTDDSSDRKKEKRPSTAAAAPLAVGGGAKGGGGGRLDALLSGSGRGVGALGALSLPPRPAAALDFMEVRRVKARAIGHVQSNKGEAGGSAGLGGCEHRTATPSAGVASGTGAADFHVIDLQAVGRRDNDDMDTSGMGGGGARGAVKGGAAAEGRAGAPILSPGERQMDAAIFKAFQTGDLSSVRDLLATCSPLTPAGVNYRRRLGDASTALMAAAFHGDLETVRFLLSLGARASPVDAGGRSAATFAGMRGHRECFAELQRLADEEEKEERARTTKSRGSAGGAGAGDDGLDFVYDLYYFEPSASKSPTEGASAPGGTRATVVPSPSGRESERAPVVQLSGIGPVDENAVGTTAGVELEFEHDSDWSELGDGDDGEDPDSNSEGYYGNDYPEDEGDEDDGAGGAPYIYGAGSGSSCASENGSSSSGGGFDSDSDVEQYSRRVVDMTPDDEDGLPGGGAGVAGSMGGAEEADSTLHVGLGSADVFAWDPKR